ncbi:hypothetical protein HMPREF3230_01137 [Gardnerella vaginalis]|uniref:Uncharacterized protein n=1 Tax=Gardnerella vaginalis TaxID=2702 RepID=A0A135Z3T4_GARVA|nr:hypothetical protein HMPREF3230_01137 [Gardnerella vaginalis]
MRFYLIIFSISCELFAICMYMAVCQNNAYRWENYGITKYY